MATSPSLLAVTSATALIRLRTPRRRSLCKSFTHVASFRTLLTMQYQLVPRGCRSVRQGHRQLGLRVDGQSPLQNLYIVAPASACSKNTTHCNIGYREEKLYTRLPSDREKSIFIHAFEVRPPSDIMDCFARYYSEISTFRLHGAQ